MSTSLQASSFNLFSICLSIALSQPFFHNLSFFYNFHLTIFPLQSLFHNLFFFTNFLSQSLFHNFSFTISLPQSLSYTAHKIFLSQPFSHNLLIEIFVLQSFFYNLSFTVFL